MSKLFTNNILEIFYYKQKLLICFTQKIAVIPFTPELKIEEEIQLQYKQQKYILINSSKNTWLIISINIKENIITFTTEKLSKNFHFHRGKIIDISAVQNNSYCLLYLPEYKIAQTSLLNNGSGLNSGKLSIYDNKNKQIAEFDKLPCTSYKCYFDQQNVIVLYGLGLIIIDITEDNQKQINFRFKELIEEGAKPSIQIEEDQFKNVFASYKHNLFQKQYDNQKNEGILQKNQMDTDNQEEAPTVQLNPRLIILNVNEYILITDHQGLYSICYTQTNQYQLNKIQYIKCQFDEKLVFNGQLLINKQLFVYGLMQYGFYLQYSIQGIIDKNIQLNNNQTVNFLGMQIYYNKDTLQDQINQFIENTQVDSIHIRLEQINRIYSESSVMQAVDSSNYQQHTVDAQLSLLHYDGTIQQIKSSIQQDQHQIIYNHSQRPYKIILLQQTDEFIDIFMHSNKCEVIRLYINEETNVNVTDQYFTDTIKQFQLIQACLFNDKLLLVGTNQLLIYDLINKEVVDQQQQQSYTCSVIQETKCVYVSDYDIIRLYQVTDDYKLQLINEVDIFDKQSFLKNKYDITSITISEIDQQIYKQLLINNNITTSYKTCQVLIVTLINSTVLLFTLDFNYLINFNLINYNCKTQKTNLIQKYKLQYQQDDIHKEFNDRDDYKFQQNSLSCLFTSQFSFITDGYTTYGINWLYGGGAQIYQLISQQNVDIWLIQTQLITTDMNISQNFYDINLLVNNDKQYLLPPDITQINNNTYHISNQPIQLDKMINQTQKVNISYTPFSYILTFTSTHGLVVFKDNQTFNIVGSQSKQYKVQNTNQPLRSIIQIDGGYLGLSEQNNSTTDIVYIQGWNYGKINDNTNVQDLIDRNMPNSIGLYRRFLSFNKYSTMFTYHKQSNQYVVIHQRYELQKTNYSNMTKDLLKNILINQIINYNEQNQNEQNQYGKEGELQSYTHKLIEDEQKEYNYYCYQPVFTALLIDQQGNILDQSEDIYEQVNCINSCRLKSIWPERYTKKYFQDNRHDQYGKMDRRIRDEQNEAQSEVFTDQHVKEKVNECIFIGTGYIMEMMNKEYGKIFMFNIEDKKEQIGKYDQLTKINIQEVTNAVTAITEVENYSIILTAQANVLEGYEIHDYKKFVRRLRTYGFGYIYNIQDATYSDYILLFRTQGMRISKLGTLPMDHFEQGQQSWQWLVNNKNSKNKSKGQLLLSDGFNIYELKLQQIQNKECQVQYVQNINEASKIVSNITIPGLIPRHQNDNRFQSTWNSISVSLSGQIVENICVYQNLVEYYIKDANEFEQMIINHRANLQQGYW